MSVIHLPLHYHLHCSEPWSSDRTHSSHPNENIIIKFSISVGYLVKHDVESHAEGKDVEYIPKEEIGKCFEDMEEHCHINIVPGQAGMFGNECNQLT